MKKLVFLEEFPKFIELLWRNFISTAKWHYNTNIKQSSFCEAMKNCFE